MMPVLGKLLPTSTGNTICWFSVIILFVLIYAGLFSVGALFMVTGLFFFGILFWVGEEHEHIDNAQYNAKVYFCLAACLICFGIGILFFKEQIIALLRK